MFHRWFFGNITRADAKKLLSKPENPAGTFMIRESQTHCGAYALSFKNKSGRIIHVLLRKKANGMLLYHYIILSIQTH